MNCICLRCGHPWQARVPNPVRCPACMSPYWNKPRQRVTGLVAAPKSSIEVLREIASGVVEPDEIPPEPCAYTEFDSESGETYACALQQHGPKVPHQRGRKL